MVEKATNLVYSTLALVSLEDFKTDGAQKRFLDFQNTGIINSSSRYEDSMWKLTDEYSNIGLYFKFNRFQYSNFTDIFQIDYHTFLSYTKAFAVSLLGRIALRSIECVLLDLRHILASNYENICNLTEPKKLMMPSLCSEFFSLLPNSNENPMLPDLMDAMDSYAGLNMTLSKTKQRDLECFETYFKFNDIINEFWGSDISKDDRLFYYPLYLWWSVTAVIPLRPREFLLTQRDCLTKTDSRYTLTLMRNRIKGSNRGISYKIAEDYYQTTYPIPETLGKEFEQYLKLTQSYSDTDIKTLFVTDPHYKKWQQRKHLNSRYLTYVNLSTILLYFYKEIIVEKYHYNIIQSSGKRHLSDTEIGMIHLGDTRHIAIINLMQEGGTPAAAMFLAGHTNEIMSAHYGSNVAELIECKTYRTYRQLTANEHNYTISKSVPALTVGTGKILSDGSTCFSPAYANGSYDDCLQTAGPAGEIAYCPSCQYYRKGINAFFEEDNIYRRQIKEDVKELLEAIEIVKSHSGDSETIGQALLRLHSSSQSYSAFLMSKFNTQQ